MKTLNYGGATNIFLDRCDTCNGIWLDAGEIMRVKKVLEPNATKEALVSAFSEQWKEEAEIKKRVETLVMIPYLLFSPALLLPAPDVFSRENYVPKVTICLILLAAVLNWRVTMGFDIFFPWVAVILFFWAFGKNVERRLSALEPYIFLCALAALVGGVATLFEKGIPVGQSPLVAMASMVSGVMGAYLVFFPREKIPFLVKGNKTSIPAYIYLLGWLAFQFVGIPSETTMGMSFVSNIAGFIFGMIFAIVWSKYEMRKNDV